MVKRSRASLSTTLPFLSRGHGLAVAQRTHEVRGDITTARNVKSTAKGRTLAMIKTNAGQEHLLREFDGAVYSHGSASVRDSQCKTWHEWHVAWYGDSVPLLPLTPDKIRAVGSCFKHANYGSFENYTTRITDEHQAVGFAWTDLLDRCMRNAHRAVNRGLGPPKSAMPLDLMKVAALPLVIGSYMHLALAPETWIVLKLVCGGARPQIYLEPQC